MTDQAQRLAAAVFDLVVEFVGSGGPRRLLRAAEILEGLRFDIAGNARLGREPGPSERRFVDAVGGLVRRFALAVPGDDRPEALDEATAVLAALGLMARLDAGEALEVPL